MRFDKKSGRWIDEGGPRGMGKNKFIEQEKSIAKESRRRWKILEEKRVREGLTVAEADQQSMLSSYADDHWESALRTTEARVTAESVGRDNLNADRRFAAEDRRDEIRQVYKPGMSAGDVLNALIRAKMGQYPRSTIEKDLRKIRGAVK